MATKWDPSKIFSVSLSDSYLQVSLAIQTAHAAGNCQLIFVVMFEWLLTERRHKKEHQEHLVQ